MRNYVQMPRIVDPQVMGSKPIGHPKSPSDGPVTNGRPETLADKIGSQNGSQP